jgi:hypothetical protein
VLLWKFFDLPGCGQFSSDRRNTSSRPASAAEVDDILGIFELADKACLLQNLRFVPMNLDRVPRFSPEELNIGSVNEKQAILEANINVVCKRVESIEIANVDCSGLLRGIVDRLDKMDTNHSATSCQQNQPSGVIIDSLKSQLDTFSSKLDIFTQQLAVAPSVAAVDSLKTQMDNIGSKLDTLSRTQEQQQLRHGTNASSEATAAGPNKLFQFDRSNNIVIFGVAEYMNADIWRDKVFDVLKCVMGRPVAVADMFRIGGRYVAHKVRPILVKLKSAWDRRSVLSNSFKLKLYPGRIFIAADEPLESRRLHTMDRLRRRASREGRDAKVVDGQLLIDNVVVFTVTQGRVSGVSGAMSDRDINGDVDDSVNID